MKVVFSPSGDLLAASDSDGGVAVWDLRYLDGEPLIFSNKRVFVGWLDAQEGSNPDILASPSPTQTNGAQKKGS